MANFVTSFGEPWIVNFGEMPGKFNLPFIIGDCTGYIAFETQADLQQAQADIDNRWSGRRFKVFFGPSPDLGDGIARNTMWMFPLDRKGRMRHPRRWIKKQIKKMAEELQDNDSAGR